MHIEFDKDACIGSGICESIAEDVFQVGDGGVMTVVTDDVADERRNEIEQAVSRCPTGAISIASKT
jgi:ferredoxin